jgi:DNA polymerase III subunit beta
MEVSVKREELVRGLYLVQGVVERRNTQPILSHVLIEPADSGLALVATDMEVGLRCLLPAQIKKKGTTTVNARKLYEIAREVTAEELTLRTSSEGWVEVIAGRSRFKVVSFPPKDFPELPLGVGVGGGTQLRVATGTLREMIDKTIFAVSTDETRFNLSGVFVETSDPGTLRMVATDGHRLALVERAVADAKIPRGVIMSRKGLAEVRKLLDETGEAELTLVVAEKDVRVHTPAVSFFMRLIEGEFPDYKQVIPSAPRLRAQLGRDDFLAAVRRTALMASERSHGVKMHLENGTLELSASNPDAGEASEDLEVAYTGDPITIGFNGKYLIDVLGVHAAGDVIELGLTDEVGPGVVHGSQDPTYTYVLMPMRL